MKPLELAPNDYLRLSRRIADLTADFLTTLDARRIFPVTSGAETGTAILDADPRTWYGRSES